MSVSTHISKLRKKHQQLSRKVEQVQRSPGSNDQEIVMLKKQKLRIKEEILRLSS
ncbi:MAG: YdcH family protein [Rhodobacteraceae bacterium]|nr:YdcH family protein [Paracoccaceae bacterium]